MAKKIWFRPKPGVDVPYDPVREPGVLFPAQGEWTALTPYIIRRLNEGCGEALDAPPADADAAPAVEQPPPPPPTAADFAEKIGKATRRFRTSRTDAAA